MTTDSPRELRIAAQRCLECDEPLRRRIDALAEYILATVRDDDGEDQPNIVVRFATWCLMSVSDVGLVMRVEHGRDDEYSQIRIQPKRPTRGQFRALCRGLGIEVPE
jgi:hypothetical protein